MKIKPEDLLLSAFLFMLALTTFRPAYDYSIVRLLLADIFAAAIYICLLLRRRKLQLPLPILAALTCLVSWVTVSVAFSTVPDATLRELAHFLTYVLIFLAASQLNLSLFSLTCWFLSVVILCLTGLYDQFQAGIGLVTPLGNKNFFAGYLILILPAALGTLWLTLSAWRAKARKTTENRIGPNKKSGRQKIGLLRIQNAAAVSRGKHHAEPGGDDSSGGPRDP